MPPISSGRLPEAVPPQATAHPAFGADAATAPRAAPLIALWAIVLKRKWVLVGAVVIALLVGLILTLLATPQYTATATLQLERESSNFTNVEGATRKEGAINQEFYQTQYGLLKSESLATQVALALHLQDNAHFFQALNPSLAKSWFDGAQVRSTAPSRDARLRTASAILLSHISVNSDRNSQLVNVSFTSPDPQLSKQIADAWGTQFIQGSLDRRYQTTAYARNFLEQRLSQLRGRLDQSERSLVEYGAQQGIISVPSGGGSDDAGGGGSGHDVPMVATNLAALNAELGKATAARIIAQSRTGGGNQVTAESLSSSTISALRTRRAEIAADYAKLLQQFDPAFPAARALRSQLAVLDKDIAAEEGRVSASLQNGYQAAAARENDLQKRVDTLKQQYVDLRRRGIQYNIIQRDVDTNRQLYAALLQRYKEIGVAGGVGVNNISIIDQADVPVIPSSPKLFLNMAVALLAGLLAGAGIILVLEQMDAGFSDPADVSQTLRIALLGTVPKVSDDELAQAIADPKAAVSEAYTSIQTTMNFATDHGFPRTLSVTSSRPGEGKSTTSYALARRLAQLGRSTLLIDGDMRSPSVAKMTGVDGRIGLSNYLSGSDDIQALIQPIAGSALMVMSAGASPPSTTELLASNRMPMLLAELAKHFDHVVIDSPPVMGLADAPLLSGYVEGTVFVIESHATTKGTARIAINRMLGARASVIGAVLTKFDHKNAAYGYGYDYSYSYSYSYGSKAKTE